MDDKTLKLLDDHGTLILPEEIEHSTYRLLLETLLHVGDKPLALYCHGEGGMSATSRAMVDLIRQHGNVTGMLAGEACSAHGIVWAACRHRFVYPHGALGVHMVAKSQMSTRGDALTYEQTAADFNRMDMENAHVLAEASNHSAEWWYDLTRKTGSGGITMFTAPQLLLMEMARPIAEYQEAAGRRQFTIKDVAGLNFGLT
jgi:ATP-dependent protease ClpP protease subunit